MKNINEHTITEAVIARLANAKNTRITQISESLVRHLHDFVREVELTEEEWFAGIDFLTRTGQMCDAARQEFILLSDTLGISMLVDAINHRRTAGVTETTILGPFYSDAATRFPLGANLSEGMEGMPMIVTGSVNAVGGTALPGAQIDVWHSDAAGFYDVQKSTSCSMRGRFEAGVQGEFWFWSIRPSAYPIPSDGPVGQMLQAQGRHPYRPAHVHFKIRAPGYQTLITHLFARGDAYLDSDVVFGVKSSLIQNYEEQGPGTAPDGRCMGEPYIHLHHRFLLEPSSPHVDSLAHE